MHLKSFITIAIGLFSTNVFAHDVCQTQFTRMHYAQSRCFDVERPVKVGSADNFKIHSVLVTKDLNLVSQRPTVVIIPGGPGESSEPLKTELQKKDFINGMWGPMEVNVVMFDPRGTGMSTLPQPITSYDGSVLSTANQVEDLKAVIDTIEPRRPVYFLAHSAGGHIALAFAERYPDRVSKMLLLSASSSPRQMAQLNLATFAKDSSFWPEFLKRIPAEQKAALTAKYQHVEDVLIQQLKARVLKTSVHPNLKPINPMDFRNAIVERMQKDPSGESVIRLVEGFDKSFYEMDQEGPQLVPEELRDLKLTAKDMRQFNYSAKEWIQLNIMCGEGLLESEADLPIVYDGLTMRHFCKDVHVKGPVQEPRLEQIATPVVFLSGEEDSQVPNYIAREITTRLPNAKLVVTPGTGHVFVDKKPMVLYNAVEAMIKSPNTGLQARLAP